MSLLWFNAALSSMSFQVTDAAGGYQVSPHWQPFFRTSFTNWSMSVLFTASGPVPVVTGSVLSEDFVQATTKANKKEIGIIRRAFTQQ